MEKQNKKSRGFIRRNIDFKKEMWKRKRKTIWSKGRKGIYYCITASSSWKDYRSSKRNTSRNHNKRKNSSKIANSNSRIYFRKQRIWRFETKIIEKKSTFSY